MGSFTIISGKEGASPKKPLFLVSIVAPDGDTTYLTTASYYGAPSITYNGNTYLARIQKNDLQAIQATGPQGYDSVPGFTMTLADADKSLWTNHVVPHGWRGGTVTLTAILWDVVANAYSTDAITWTFIAGNPQHNHAQGQTTLDVTAATNFTRLKLPSVPVQYRCPWAFPTTLLQRIAALNDPSSPYYQCGYSADVSGGVGNLIASTTLSGSITAGALSAIISSASGLPAVPFQATLGGAEEILVTAAAGTTLTIARGQHGTTAQSFGSGTSFMVPFTTDDYTRSSPTDPSVGCMARMGNAATTTVAPDGDLTRDKAGHYTARFGGCTFIAPSAWSGKQYVSGQQLFGFNAQNPAIIGAYINMIYGTQWVNGLVLAPAADPNSMRSEVILGFAPFGPVQVLQVLVNGVLVPQDNSDQLFTWRFNSQPSTPGNTSAGGRSGALSNDNYFKDSSHSGLSDPHGSMCVIEFVVPAQLAGAGSVPTVQALVTSGPIMQCYAIASITSGVVTFTGPNLSCAGNPPFSITIRDNSNSALNGIWELTSWAFGPPGTVTLQGTTASGTGGAAFFQANPDLRDSSSFTPSTQDSVPVAPAANLLWIVLDLMLWGNITIDQIDPVSWYAAAQIAAASVSYIGADGNSYSHAQYKACLQLPGNARQTLSSIITGLRNAGNLMIAPNSTTGLIQCYVKQGLADQQPAAIPGSNDSTPRTSWKATDTTSPTGTGYFAYLFDETNIEKGSFKITSTRIESTPNTVAFPFQDEYNSYQQDSLTEIDPSAYAYSGNQEIAVPVPVMGIPNFDQGTRIANTQLAEALYGNPRNDPGGTLYFEFSINHRVIHLASRLGYICGLTWQELSIGTSTPQPVRILSLKPDTDGEHWQAKCGWHDDQWYTYAYGQNPAPYQQNPALGPPARSVYPWRPGQGVWATGDPILPGRDGFLLALDASQYPAQLTIEGAVPVNAQPSGRPPLVPLQATTANTGGSIPPGTYSIAFSTNGQNGPVSNFVTAVVPAGTNTNTITVSGLQWQSGAAPSIQPFIGTSMMKIWAAAAMSYSGSSPDGSGNPTSYTFTAITPDGLGLPDIKFSSFLVQETGIVHGGLWGDAITSVDGTGTVLTFAAGAWSANQWGGYILSLYYRPNVPLQPALNIQVSSSTSNTLTMASAGFTAGDIVVLRAAPDSITSNTIGDGNFVNSYAPSGLTVNGEVGNLIMIIAGTGAGMPPKPIKSNTATVFTIQGTWDVQPDSTSIYIILSPTVAYSYPTNTIPNSDGTTVRAIATTPAITLQDQQLLVQVATVDASGNMAPWQYQPFREIYIPGIGGTIVVAS